MATTTEDIIFSIKLDVAQTTAALKTYTAEAKAAADANLSVLQATKLANDEADRQAAAAKKTQAALDMEAGSIAQLREQNKQLTYERNNTTLATEAGRAKVEELNKHLDANNAKIKENVDSYTKQKIGIGGYKEALDSTIPGLGAFMEGLEGMKTAALAFMATPIGLVLGALALAVGAVVTYFKGSEEGQEKWNKIVSIGSAIVKEFTKYIIELGGFLVEAFEHPKQTMLDLVEFLENNIINRFKAFGVIIEGIKNMDFKQVANGLLQSATGVVDIIGKVQKLGQEIVETSERAIAEGSRMAALQKQVDADERKLIVERAQISLETSRLRQKAIFEEYQQRKATVMEAIALDGKLSDDEVKAAQVRLAQARLEQQEGTATIESKRKIAEAEAAVLAAEQIRFDATKRFQKELEAIENQEEAERKRIAAEKLAAFKKEWDAKVKATQEANDNIAAEAQKEFAIEQKIQSDKIKAQTELQTAEKKLASDSEALVKAGLGNSKAAGLIDIAIQEGKAIASLIAASSANELNPVTFGAAGAAQFASGMIEITTGILDAISIVNGAPAFDKGGISGTRITADMGTPINRSNGDNLLATVRTGEVILNERQQAMLGGSATFRAMNVPGFNFGGTTSHIEPITSPYSGAGGQGDMMLKAVHSAIKSMRPVLVLQDFEFKQGQRNAIKTQASLLG